MKTCLLFFLLHLSSLEATASSIFWTFCTTDVFPTGTASLEVDNFFTIFNRRGHGQSLPPDVGLDVGFLTIGNWEAEFGFDYDGGTDDPLFLNAKIGIKEDKLFKHAPGFSIGMFNAGTRTRGDLRTNQNVLDVVFGKTLPEQIGGGRFFIGFYSGSKALGEDRQGYMVAYTHPFVKAKDCEGKEYHKWLLSADYASGKNFIGGGGVALTYYFTPNITFQTGPVFFNTARFNGTWKWGTLVTYNFPVEKKKKKTENREKQETKETKEYNKKATTNTKKT